jgi:DNA-binding transcriptional regulator YhcF (GntR family)
MTLKFQKIVNELRFKIVSGEYLPGAKLPGRHELARLYGVSAITATRALGELSDMCLVERKERCGTFVLESPRLLNKIYLVMSGQYDNELESLTPYWRTITVAAEKNGIQTRLVSATDAEFAENVLENPHGSETGVILLRFEDERLIQKLSDLGIPHVVAGVDANFAGYNATENRFEAAEALTRRMLEFETAKIAFFGKLNSSNHTSALNGCRSAISKIAEQAKLVVIEANEENIAELLNKSLNSSSPPDALFIMGSLMPFMALPVILKANKRPIFGVMTENETVLGLCGTAIVASYSQTQAAEFAFKLLMRAAAQPNGDEIKLTEFEILD